MARPTLFQSLFHQPSQSYYVHSQPSGSGSVAPPTLQPHSDQSWSKTTHNYYSAKKDLLNLASETSYSARQSYSLSPSPAPIHLSSISTSFPSIDSVTSRNEPCVYAESEASCSMSSVENRSYSDPNRDIDKTGALTDSDNETDEIFYTPNNSPPETTDVSFFKPQFFQGTSDSMPTESSLNPQLSHSLPADLDSRASLSSTAPSRIPFYDDMDRFTSFSFKTDVSMSTELTSPVLSEKDKSTASSISQDSSPMSLPHATRTSLYMDRPLSVREWPARHSTRSLRESSKSTLPKRSKPKFDSSTPRDSQQRRSSSVSSRFLERSGSSNVYYVEVIDSSRQAQQKRIRRTPSTSLRRTSINVSLGVSNRMSAVLEEDEVDECDSAHDDLLLESKSPVRKRSISSSYLNHAKPLLPHDHNRKRTSSFRSPPSVNAKASTLYATVDIPPPLPLIGSSTPAGLTRLVLPKASYRPSQHPGRVDGVVDLTSLGLAQTTMGSIEIQKNAAAKLALGRGFRSLRGAVLKSDKPVFDSVRDSSPLPPLCFTSHLQPPSKVNPNEVLVQVWAVAVDGLDSLLVSEKCLKLESVGYIPGRSFVGRAIEVGFDVTSIVKGDLVYGLMEIQKSGALCEFVTIDKRRLHRAPRPSIYLALEQIAVLPLCGIPAHRAVSTFIPFIQKPGSKVLILQSHKGVGALACQELVARGVSVTAQIPKDREWRYSSGLSRDRLNPSVVSHEPEPAISSLPDAEFAGILDTVGGPIMWKSCRRVLHTAGQFTTTTGDSTSAIPSVNEHFKSNLRSLRRAFVKKDRKRLGYSWVSPAFDLDHEGNDIHRTLSDITLLAEAGILRPYPDTIVPFEKAANSFPLPSRTGGSVSDIVVVRIVY